MNPNWVVAVPFVLVCLAQGAHAAPLSEAITYQGRLRVAGQPADGQFSMDFRLFDTDSLGTQVGATIRQVVTVTNGLFTAELNDAGQFGPAAFDGDSRWLEITVDGTTMAPRQPITALPYAQTAVEALSVVGIDGHSLDAADGSPLDALLVDAAGNVGIGIGTPADRLHVATGNVLLGTGVNLQKQDSAGVARAVMVYDGSDNAQYFAPPDKMLQFRTGTAGFTSIRATIMPSGRVGVGTTDPDVLMHLMSGTPGDSGTVTASNLLLERNGDNYLTFMSPVNRLGGLAFGRPGSTSAELFHGAITYNEAALPDSMQFKTGGNLTRMTIDAAGEVGIGTTAPSEPLHIVNAADASLRLERTGGSTVTTSAQSAAGQVGTTNAFPLQVMTNNTVRMTVSSTGSVGINTASPTGRLHVVDAVGGNGTVVLPASAISAAETLDEPGVAGVVHTGSDVDITAFFPDPPQSVLSQSITAPTSGHVLAIATIGATSFTLDASQCRWGLTTDPSMPAAELAFMMMAEFQPTPQQPGYWSVPVSLHRLLPVSSGTTTVHVMAQQFTGNWEFDRATLSLIFFPTTYGTAPSAAGMTTAPTVTGREATAETLPSSSTDGYNAALLEEIRAEREVLRSELEALRVLRADLELLRDQVRAD